MRSLLLSLSLVILAACYQQTQIKLAPGGTIQVGDESWEQGSDDRVRFADARANWTAAIPANQLVRVGDWICVATDVSLADLITDVRISPVDDATLPGFIAGIDKPSARMIEDGAVELFFEDGEVESWLTARAHREPEPDRRHYEIGFQGIYTPIAYSWAELRELRNRPARFGWPIAEIRNGKLERGDPRTLVLLALPLLPIAVVGVALVGTASAVAHKGSGGNLERRRHKWPRVRGSSWQPRLCDPQAIDATPVIFTGAAAKLRPPSERRAG